MDLRRVVAVAVWAGVASSLWAADGSWSNTSGGVWSLGDNWLGGIVADGAGSTAWFTNAAPGMVTVANDADRALLGIKLGGNGFTLAGNTVTNDAGGAIETLAGDHAVLLPLSLSGATAVTVVTNRTLTLGGVVSGSGGLTFSGGRLAVTNANTYAGATRHVTGILEISSPAALGASAADPANLVLGDGTLRYTGPSATLDRGYTMAPGVSSNRAVVIDVTNANTTLTVAGRVLAPGGSFIKTGNGTLAFTYPGFQELNKSKLPNAENGAISYSANGVAATNEYSLFTVERGRMILGAPGQSNVIIAASGWVGCKTLASPRLDITGGVTRFTSGYFTVGRGTGTPASPQSPSLYINGGAYVAIEGSGLVLDNAQGLAPNHRCRPVLNISNATLRVFNDCFLSEDTYATTVVSVASSGRFISESQTPYRGMSISQSAGAKTDVTFDSASTGTVYMLRVNTGGTLNVFGNSVFEMDGSPTNVVLDRSNAGTVRVSGGTLKQRTAKRSSDWLVRLGTLLVGANNMTVDVSSHAWMDGSAQPDPASPGGQIVKTGAGTLAPRAAGVNIQVNAGKVAMSVDHPYVTNGLSGVLTMAAGTSVEVAGANALSDMTVTPGTTPFTFSPHSLSSKHELWAYNGYSMRRRDGLLRLTPDIGGQVGSAFLYRKAKVDGPWTANFAFITWSTGTPADGFSFVIHNDPRGAYAIGSGSANLGYTGSPWVTNSVAVGIDVYNRRVRFGKQGSFLVNNPNNTLPAFAATPVKTYFKVSYDGAGTLAVDMTRSDLLPYHYTYPVNVAAEVGGGEAYVGFTGGTGGSQGQHSIADFTFENGSAAPVSYCRHGGKTSLAGGETLTASLLPSAQQNGFVFGRLNYADQSVLNVTTPATTADLPLPSLADQGLWRLNGPARWKTGGGLALTTNEVSQPMGSAFMTNRYPIAGSWTARFGYDLGLANSTPADFFTFQLQNVSTNNTSEVPNPGLSIMWRYYDGNIRTTQIKIYTNGSLMTVASTNIVPVDLKSGAHARMTVAYDAINTNLTVTTVQDGAGTNVTTVGNFNLQTILGGLAATYVGFTGATGGSYAENIVSDFSFTSEGLSAAQPKPGYLAFDQLSGGGTLVKRGTGGIGLMGDLDRPTSNAVLRLEGGGLVLRKNSLEPLDLSGARSDWIFSPLGQWGDDGTLQVCPAIASACGVAGTTRRVCVSNAWTATFSFLFGAKSTPPADAFCMFLHNDPRGSGYASGTAGSAGYSGVAKSIGLRWYFYPNDPNGLTNSVTLGRAGAWTDATRQYHSPICLTNGVTGFIIRYNPSAATLTSVVTQGVYAVTNVFTGVNIPTDVGDGYAYVGFGGGTGGSYGEMRVRDFRMANDQAVDTAPDHSYLAGLILPDLSSNSATLDTSVPSSTFRIASATVGSGASLGVKAWQQAGTLAVGSTALSGSAAFAPDAGCALELGNVTGGTSVTKSGAGTLALAGEPATYAGDTVLAAGTLALDAPRLPEKTDLRVASSATLNLAFVGKQYVHALFVDGAAMPGGQYTAAKAAWISGPGTLVVTYPPVGTMLLLQ